MLYAPTTLADHSAIEADSQVAPAQQTGFHCTRARCHEISAHAAFTSQRRGFSRGRTDGRKRHQNFYSRVRMDWPPAQRMKVLIQVIGMWSIPLCRLEKLMMLYGPPWATACGVRGLSRRLLKIKGYNDSFAWPCWEDGTISLAI